MGMKVINSWRNLLRIRTINRNGAQVYEGLRRPHSGIK